jgi:hypothetical protein
MNPKNFVPLTLSMIVLSMLTTAEVALTKGCSITKSIYRDRNGNGFELVFGQPPPNTPYAATATINHSQSGQIYRFTVSQSSGYGSVWLSDRSSPNSARTNQFWIAFFDRNLISATPLWLGDEKEAPKYAVIAEIGSYDYYRRRGTENPPLIGDVIWLFDRCQLKLLQLQGRREKLTTDRFSHK